MIPVQKMPITDQVVEKIMASIADGNYAEGAKLPAEQSLCAELNVSRSTVREAFRVLQTMGYIELKPGRGAFVRSRSGNDMVNVRDWFLENALQMKDFIEVREAIESLAIKKAIEKGGDDEFARLEDLHRQFVEAVKTNDVVEMAFLDESFHNFIVGMTHNSLLININRLVSDEFKKYRKISFSVRANAESAVKEHHKIMAALRARAQQIAAESIAHHLNMVVVDMESVISD